MSISHASAGPLLREDCGTKVPKRVVTGVTSVGGGALRFVLFQLACLQTLGRRHNQGKLDGAASVFGTCSRLVQRRYVGNVYEGKDFANNPLRVMNFRSVVWAFADSLNAAAQ